MRTDEAVTVMDMHDKLKAEIASLRAALKDAAGAVERLAFVMPAPNNYTPQFVQLANVMRLRSDEQTAGDQS
jgi:hypothetical protein